MNGDLGQEIGGNEQTGFKTPEVTGTTAAQEAVLEASDPSAKGGPDPNRANSDASAETNTKPNQDRIVKEIKESSQQTNPHTTSGLVGVDGSSSAAAHDSAMSVGANAKTPNTTEVDKAAVKVNKPGFFSRTASRVSELIRRPGHPPTTGPTPQNPVANPTGS